MKTILSLIVCVAVILMALPTKASETYNKRSIKIPTIDLNGDGYIGEPKIDESGDVIMKDGDDDPHYKSPIMKGDNTGHYPMSGNANYPRVDTIKSTIDINKILVGKTPNVPIKDYYNLAKHKCDLVQDSCTTEKWNCEDIRFCINEFSIECNSNYKILCTITDDSSINTWDEK